MLLIDDMLMFVFRKIHEAALQERHNEADAIRADLSNLYLMLETQQISEEEFAACERELLDRLDRVEDHATAVGEASDTRD